MKIFKSLFISALIAFSSVVIAEHPFYDEVSFDKPTTLAKSSPIKLGVLDKEKCYTGNLREQAECDPQMKEEILLSSERLYYSRQVKPVCVRIFSAAGCSQGRTSILSIFDKATGDYLGYENSNGERFEKIKAEFLKRLISTDVPPEMESNVRQLKFHGVQKEFLEKILNDIRVKNEEIVATALPEKSMSLYTPTEIYNIKLSVLAVKINNVKIEESKFSYPLRTSGMQQVDETLSVNLMSNKKIPFKVVVIRCAKFFDKKNIANFSSVPINLEEGVTEIKIKGQYVDDAQYPFRDKAETICRSERS